MGKKFRFSVVLVSLALALWGLYPSIWWYFVADEKQQSLASMTKNTLARELRLSTESNLLEFQKLSSKNPKALAGEVLSGELGYILAVAQNYRKEFKLDRPKAWTLEAIGKLFGGDQAGRDLMRNKLEDHQLEQVLLYRSRKDSSLRLGLDLNGGYSVIIRPNPESMEEKLKELEAEGGSNRKDIQAYLRNRVLTALRNRVDQFGLTEPEIHSYPDGRIEIILPSQNKDASAVDVSTVDSLLQVKGALQFHLVNDDETKLLATHLNANPSAAKELTEKGSSTGYNLPTGHEITGYYTKDKYDMDRLRGYLVLESDVLLDGDNIISAQLNKDQLGLWEISYSLNQAGAAKQQKIFTNHGGRAMAIVLDGRVLSYPRISSAAGGSGSFSGGRISGRFSDKEAKDLVNVLNSGNLPVSLDIESLQVVGASLGDETIRLGLFGILVGLLAVILFMLLYYRTAGLIANIVLILNLFFLIAILATMNSTMTLTGIAGIILTIGISVDANVIIYERIKEELAAGKGHRAAIEIGFAKALWTIIDANITTGIAAICLALFGNGGIQGFAITLAWGIACSLFTALFIARLILDFNTDVLKSNKLSIMWRKINTKLAVSTTGN